MKANDVEFGRQVLGTFRFLQGQPTRTTPGSLVAISFGARSDAIDFTLQGQNYSAAATDHGAREVTTELASVGPAGFAWLVDAHAGLVTLQAHIFPAFLAFASDAPLDLFVGEAVLPDLPSSNRKEPLTFFEREFLLDDLAFMIGGPAAATKSFRLLGATHVCDVVTKPNGWAECVRVLRRRRTDISNQGKPVTLLRGAIRFVDLNNDAAANRLAYQQLQTAVQSGEGYLAAWDTYNQLEQELFVQQAAELGAIEYDDWERVERGDSIELRFHLVEPLPRRWGTGIELDAAPQNPFASDDELDQDEEGDVSLDRGLRMRTSEKGVGVYVGEVVLDRTTNGDLRVRLDAESLTLWPPRHGFLYHSVRGDVTRTRRRKEALRKVQEMTCPMMRLGPLLERGDIPVVQSGYRHQQAMSDATVRAMEHKPTENQRIALDLALNTPDIALIQGPPGTGKTTVIRGLLARLVELGEKRGDQANVLISSYQHDAVENAIGGVDIGGLPARRVGGKRGTTEEERNRDLLDWIEERRRSCQSTAERLGGTPARQLARDVDRLIDHWRRVRGSELGTGLLLNDIARLAGPHLDPALSNRLVSLASRFASPQMPSSNLETLSPTAADQLRRVLECQRTDEVGFLDDGPFQAKRLMSLLQQFVPFVGQAVPESVIRATKWNSSSAEPGDQQLGDLLGNYREALRELQGRFFGSRPALVDDNSVAELDDLLQAVSHALHQHAEHSRDGVAEAVSAFAEELQDLQAVRNMIDRYTGVLAGTCQQVVSYSLGLTGRTYEYVIIDEAARANPLDLLIPMSLGKRVILVGDHKQLPHILEPEIVEAYAKDRDPSVLEFLNQSMFARLFDRFQKVHDQGGPRRTVRLIDDFRMHPMISQFISHTFYEGGVEARAAEAQLQHNLDMYNGCPVAWLDIPWTQERGEFPPPGRGRARQGEFSRYRPAEVAPLCDEVRAVLRQNEHYRIGVITFYRAQARLLAAELQKLGYEELKRIRVGTVDEFQGRQFDVVFLSTVRSNEERDDPARRVGFLESPNRLCVALSRAQRLLVIVGDADTVAGLPPAPASVPSLRGFLELCQAEGSYERR